MARKGVLEESKVVFIFSDIDTTEGQRASAQGMTFAQLLD
jgi:hypothetical protein